MSNNGPQIVKILDLLSEPIERHTIQFFSNSNPADPNHIPDITLEKHVLNPFSI